MFCTSLKKVSLFFLLCCFIGENTFAAEASYPAVTLPNTQMRVMTSSATGKDYRIVIYVPPVKAPPGGFPVIYHMDPYGSFATFVESLNVRARRTASSGVVPAVVVGIGYPTDDWTDRARRTYDLTLSAKDYDWSGPAPMPALGGADVFLSFLEKDLMPVIERDFKINKDRRTLMGHSFGGLFTLHTLFTRPDLFQTYVAGSPSIWFNDEFLLSEEKTFIKNFRPDGKVRNILITVGGLEQRLNPAVDPGPKASENLARMQGRKMVSNAADMAARLALYKDKGLNVAFTEFDGEEHGSVVPGLVSRAVGFALKESDKK